MKFTRSQSVLILALCSLCVVPASAQVLYQPTAVSTNIPTGEGDINNIINQSGLSVGYTSGATPLAGYNATHDSLSTSTNWGSSLNSTTGDFIFDLGTVRDIGTYLLWNDASFLVNRIASFTLSASNISDFSSGVTNLGNFTTSTTGPTFATNLEAFSFSPATARYFRMSITANAGSPFFTYFGEAAFAGAAAPEPATFALLALGAIAGSVGARRRKA